MLDRTRDDDGFTLVETLAAMIVFSIFAVSVAGVIVNTFGLTKSNSARVVAANLAAQQIEAVRAVRAVDVPDGAVTVTPKPVVNGVEYTVVRTANPVAADSSTSPCTGPATSGGVRLAYKLVTVDVTWPGMGSLRPVRSDTLLNLGVGFGSVDATTGTGAISVRGSDDTPRSGVVVTLTPGGAARTTGSDGCAVFVGLNPAVSYSAAVDQAGWVDKSGVQRSVSAAFAVSASGITRVTMSYGRPGSLVMNPVPPTGLPVPADLGVTLSSSNFNADTAFGECPAGVTSRCVSGMPRTASQLFPGTYAAWSGTCADARPDEAVTAAVTPSSTTTVDLPLAGVRVEVKNASGGTQHGMTVYALHEADGSCLVASRALTPAGSPSQSLALPAGTYTLALNASGTTSGADPTFKWPVVTLRNGEPVPTITVRAE